MRKKAKTPTDARLDRIFRKFWSNDRATQIRQILEAQEVLDPDEKIWDREYYREHFPTLQ